MPHYDYDKDYPFAAFITNLGKYNCLLYTSELQAGDHLHHADDSG